MSAIISTATASVTSGGIPVRGRLVPIPGLTVIPPANMGGPAWCTLTAGDHQLRRERVRQVMFHSTKGDGPQRVIPGRGSGGRAKSTFDYWHRDPVHSAAHAVFDNNGDLACGADLVDVCAYHATVSNEYSAGFELYQEADLGIYEAVYAAAAIATPAICQALDVPFYVVADPYNGHPIPRFLNGAPDFYGVCFHRNNTEQRGRYDAGDEIVARLIAAGGEPVNAGRGEDRILSQGRQRWLNNHGAKLVVDGLAGPASLAAQRAAGIPRWRDVPLA